MKNKKKAFQSLYEFYLKSLPLKELSYAESITIVGGNNDKDAFDELGIPLAAIAINMIVFVIWCEQKSAYKPAQDCLTKYKKNAALFEVIRYENVFSEFHEKKRLYNDAKVQDKMLRFSEDVVNPLRACDASFDEREIALSNAKFNNEKLSSPKICAIDSAVDKKLDTQGVLTKCLEYHIVQNNKVRDGAGAFFAKYPPEVILNLPPLEVDEVNGVAFKVDGPGGDERKNILEAVERIILSHEHVEKAWDELNEKAIEIAKHFSVPLSKGKPKSPFKNICLQKLEEPPAVRVVDGMLENCSYLANLQKIKRINVEEKNQICNAFQKLEDTRYSRWFWNTMLGLITVIDIVFLKEAILSEDYAS